MNIKDKGSRLEYMFRDMLIESGLDSHAHRTPMSGAIEGMKSDILTKLPFAIECKNQERWDMLRYYTQARIGVNLGSGKVPIVVVKSNKTKPFVFFDAQDFINLVCYAVKAGYPNGEL